MPFACLYVPNFPVESLLRSAPQLRHEALAILDGKPPLVKVIAVNGRAREKGIVCGMTRLEAEACPGLHLEMRSVEEEQSAHAALLDCAHAFSPVVEDTNFCPRRGLASRCALASGVICPLTRPASRRFVACRAFFSARANDFRRTPGRRF